MLIALSFASCFFDLCRTLLRPRQSFASARSRTFVLAAIALVVCAGPALAQTATPAATAYPLGRITNIAAQGNQIQGVAVDAAGDIFVANYGTGTIVKNTYNAATGTYSSAVIVNFAHISAIAVNAAGTNVFFSGFDGTLQTIMRYTGSGTSYSSTGGALGTSYGAQNFALALDGNQNLYIAYNQTIEKLFPGSNYFAGSSVLLANGAYNAPTFVAIAVDASGNNVYALNSNYNQGTDIVQHLSGSGSVLSSTTVPVATNIAVDAGLNVFLGSSNGTITRLTATGIQTTIAVGTTTSGRTQPTPSSVAPLAVDALGELFVGTVGSNVVKYSPVTNFGQVPVGSNSNTIPVAFTVSGTASSASVTTQGQAFLDFTAASSGINCSATVNAYSTCTVNVVFNPLAPGARFGAVNLLDANANVLATAALNGTGAGALAIITPGTISTIVGNGTPGNAGDGGSPASASIYNPSHLLVDALGDQFLVTYNSVREVSASTGLITTIAGGSTGPGYSGDGGPATAAAFNGVTGIALDGAGNLYIADQLNNAIRVVNLATGIVNTLVSTGVNSYPISLAFSPAGDLYIGGVSQIFKYSATTGALAAIAGQAGSAGTAGDGGPATSGQIAYTYGLAFDPAGNLIFINGGSYVSVREITAAGNLNTLLPVGQGTYLSLAIDPAGDVFLADVQRNEIVKLTPSKTAVQTVIAGNGVNSFTGDGGAATAASLSYPNAIAFDGNGDLYIADQVNQRIRLVTATPAPFTFPGINPVTSPVTTASATDTVLFANEGNVPLTLTATGGPNPSIDLPFGLSGGTCVPVNGTPMTLAAGASCTETVNFAPTVAGNSIAGSLTFTDNSDNPSSIDSQAVSFFAEAYVPIVTTTTLTVSPTVNLQQGATVTLTAAVSTADSSAPTGSLQFYDNGTPIGSPIAAGTAFTLNQTLTAGEHDISATFTGTQFDLNSLSNTAVVVAAPLTAVGTSATSLRQTVTIATAGTFGSVVALTQGVAGLDFNTPATTCTGSLSAGQTCALTYAFTPAFPGQRLGALQVLDPNGNVLGTALVSGIGNGPQAIVYSGTKKPLVSAPSNASQVTVDAAGNLYYINSYDPAVLKETLANGTYTESVVNAAVPFPRDLFVDGAGAVYISDLSQQVLVKMTPSPTGYTAATLPLSLAGAFTVDNMGDIFFIGADSSLDEATPNGSGGYTVTSLNGTASYYAFAMAVAANGDLFVAEYNIGNPTGTGDIAKYVHGSYQRYVLTNSESLTPSALALNPDGSLYVSDSAHQVIARLSPPASGYRYLATTIDTTTLPGGVAVGPNGDLYVTDNITHNIVQFDVVNPPTLSFATTVEGNTSTDSPRSITLSNVGNQPLSFSVPSAGTNPSVSANFTYGSSSTCNTGAQTPNQLAPGAACTELFSFTPTSTGSITGSAVTTDNSLNVSNASQTINLAGASDLSTTLAFTVSPSGSTTAGTSVTLTATVTASDASAAVGSVTFYDGATALATVAVANNTATYTTTSLAALTHVLTASFSGTLPYTGSQATAQTLKVYGTPIGNLDNVSNTKDGSRTFVYGDTLNVSGWAADPTDGSPITVYVTLDGSRVAAVTGQSRPDVAAYFNNTAYTNSGYALAFPASHFATGTHSVGVTVINGGGIAQSFGPYTITVLGAAPQGNLDYAHDGSSGSQTILQGDALVVSGWAGDPNPFHGSSAQSVSVLIDGKAYTATLGIARPDVANYYNQSGYASTGFSLTVQASALTTGRHTVTAVATGATGLTTTFGPMTVTVLAQAPTVQLDVAEDPTTGSTNYVSQQDNLYVSGWAADFQTPGNVASVVVMVDGAFFANATLGVSRPDVASYLNNQAYANAGYSVSASAASLGVGQHTVTVVATDHAGLTSTTGGYTIGVNNYNANRATQAPPRQ